MARPRHHRGGEGRTLGHQELLWPPLRRFWVLRAETLQPEPNHPQLPLPHGRPSCRRRQGALPGAAARPRPRCCPALGGAAATHPHTPLSPAPPRPGEALALPEATCVSLFSQCRLWAVRALWELARSVSGSMTDDSGATHKAVVWGQEAGGDPSCHSPPPALLIPAPGPPRAEPPPWGGEEGGSLQ